MRANIAFGETKRFSSTALRPWPSLAIVSGMATTIGSAPITRSTSPFGMRGEWLFGAVAQAKMAGDRAVALRQAGIVQHGQHQALDVRRHAEQGRDRDDALAADAGEQDVVHLADAGQLRIGKRREQLLFARQRIGGERIGFGNGRAPCPPITVMKLGHRPLAQEKSLLHTVWLMRRLRPSAVSSGSMAMQLDCTPQSPQPSQTSGMDEQALGRIGQLAALAHAAALGGAGLLVDDGAYAGIFAQLALHLVQRLARVEGDRRAGSRHGRGARCRR